MADYIPYNTRIVLLGTILLGMCGGVVGTWMLLRKKALVGDVASHAALPGIGLAYLVIESIYPGQGKSLFGLMIGASLTAAAGVIVSSLIQRTRLIKEDAALGIVLSLFFGAGIVLLSMIQSMKTGNVAGLNDFVFGKTAAITANDVSLIAIASLVVLVVCLIFFKEFSALCFNEDYAISMGWPTRSLDLLLTILVVSVTVIGMQSVGLLLVVSLLVIPPTAARFWSNRLSHMIMIASLIGGLSAAVGVVLSANFKNLAAGPTIVLSGTTAFTISLFCGTTRGTFWLWWKHRSGVWRKGQFDLMRTCYEELERRQPEGKFSAESLNRLGAIAKEQPISLSSLVGARSWSSAKVASLIRAAIKSESLRQDSDGQYRLTESGAHLAAQAARNHRLWELYLIHFADVAVSRVDREADKIEHVLEPSLVKQLELLLKNQTSAAVPVSPHH